MRSVSGKTAQENSAKKARQEKRWIFPVVLLLCVLLCAAAAVMARVLYIPSVYSDAFVDDYVRNNYGDSWTLKNKNRSADGTGEEYHYSGGDGSIFSVFTLSVPVYQDGVASGTYRKALFDNYFSTVIEKNMDALEALAEECQKNGGPVLETETAGEEAGAYGARYAFSLYLDEYSQIDAAAQLLSDMDGLLAFSCVSGDASYTGMRPAVPCVEVFMKPEGWEEESADAVSGAAGGAEKAHALPDAPADWRSVQERDAFRISRIPLTDRAAAGRLACGDLCRRLENDYVDAAKTFGRSYYSISEELWDKYPAPVLTLVNAGGYTLVSDPDDPEDPGKAADGEEDGAGAQSEQAIGEDSFSYQLVYHRRTGTYWMTGLDPCEDFEGNPYGDYPRRGAFARLVQYLGGSFSADQWTGTWRIGTRQWEASLKTRKTARDGLAFQDMELTCDGNRISLDAVPDVFAGTGAVPSDRPYSIRDLIKMLDIRITVNQKDMTAVMFRYYGNN